MGSLLSLQYLVNRQPLLGRHADSLKVLVAQYLLVGNHQLTDAKDLRRTNLYSNITTTTTEQ